MRHRGTKRRATYKPPESIEGLLSDETALVIVGCGTPVDRKLTLEECRAVQITFEPNGLSGVVVWRDGPKFTRPVKAGQRIRDLKPGDQVTFKGELHVVRSIEPYR